MKKKAGILAAVVLFYAVFAAGIAYFIYLGGSYPAGTDTMNYLYKGNLLFHNIQKGIWYPLYDNLWCNGIQPMRYEGPFPVYVMALCQAIAGGSDLAGYLVFVAMVFFLGAAAWLYIGVKKKRPFLGAFFGVLWFFMPNNLYMLFVEGNLAHALSMALLPLLLYSVCEYLFGNHWRELGKVVLVFTGLVFCHGGYAGMIFLAMLVFLLVYWIVYRGEAKCSLVAASFILPFLIAGVWLLPSLHGGLTSAQSTQMMKHFFQQAVVSLNPFRRITVGISDFYFGLAAFVVAVFGGICSKRKSMVGFWSAVLIFLGTTTSMYMVFNMLPGGEYLWMLRLVSIALCMILYSLLIWGTLRRWMLVVCVALLVADTLPSLPLVYSGRSGKTAQEQMEEVAENTLIDRAREITVQRAALLDGGVMGSVAPYLLTDYNGTQVQNTFAKEGQDAAIAENMERLSEALGQGCYLYLFDRCLDMGNDTVLIKISQMKYQEEDIQRVTECGAKLGYELVDSNDSFLLFHLDTVYPCFGTVCQYNGIAIGTSAQLMSLADPDIEEGDSANLDDYSYEELSQYRIIYLTGFTYHDKEQAEDLVIRLGEAGVRVIITGDGIPYNNRTRMQEFLGVTCHEIMFENGYPVFYTDDGEVDCYLFDKEHSKWKSVYFNGLEEVKGYLYESGRKIDFLGTAGNANISFIGLNLTYHYYLTHDENAGALIHSVTGSELRELPQRELVPLSVEYGDNRLVIRSDRDGVNTSLACQDTFRSGDMVEKNNLVYVDKGETVIDIDPPYLAAGIGISVLGIVLTILFLVLIKRTMAVAKSALQK